MMKNRRRRLIVAPMGALAALGAFAATAFACTVFKGTFTVKGNASATSVVATGSGSGFMTQTVSSGIAKASKTGGSVTVSTGQVSGTNKLPKGSYQIRFYNSVYPSAPGYDTHTHWLTDCMAGSSGQQIGSNVTVGTTGQIAGQPVTIPLPAGTLTVDNAPSESAVCISDKFGNTGNQAPLTIM